MHLHIDCQFGVAGDMLLAALVDAGADRAGVERILRAIPLPEFELECSRTTRNGVAAMLATVRDLSSAGRRVRYDHEHLGHDRHQDRDHHDHHDHQSDHVHPHDTASISREPRRGHTRVGERRQGPHRHLADMLALLDSETVPARARERAGRVFRIIAEAEAAVHGIPLDKVHFHEVSGIDTAVDVIGSCLALEFLGVDSVSSSPPAVGSGMMMCGHGILPIPAPATLEILKSNNIPWRPGGEDERATPTGVALLAGLADSFGDSPEITVARIGYGAGHREFTDVPNLLRVIAGKPGAPAGARERPGGTVIREAEREPLGDLVRLADRAMLPAEVSAMLPAAAAPGADRVVEFKFSVDDMTAEALGFLAERCLAAGAVDAYSVAATMKKGRPGHEVTVLAPPDLAPMVADTLWRESTTFGVRVSERSRLTLPRDFRTVTVAGQAVRVKLGWRDGRLIRRQPEYEDCRAASLAAGMPLADVFDQAKRAAAAEEGKDGRDD